MAKIFISYRRNDSEADAGRLYDKLNTSPLIETIFWDHESIKTGTDFTATIDKALNEADILLVIINRKWLSSFKKRKKQNPNENKMDFVQYEIIEAKNRGKHVIPVLIGETKLPDLSQLPNELQFMGKINAIWIRHNHFNQDVDELIKAIAALPSLDSQKQNQRYMEGLWEKYNERFMNIRKGEDYQISWHYSSETAPDTFQGSHKLTEMIKNLIEDADTHFWRKLDNEIQPEEFWLRILKAVATSRRIDYDGENGDELSDADFIRSFLPELEGVNSLWLNSKAYKIIQRITDAFPTMRSVPFEKLTWEYFDDTPELIQTFHEKSWASITSEQIEEFPYTLSTFDPKVAAFYLPAYLITSLKLTGEIVGGIVFETLSPDKELIPEKQKWLDLLTKELNYQQRNVVHQFMAWCVGEDSFFDADDEDDEAVAYWEKLITKFDK